MLEEISEQYDVPIELVGNSLDDLSNYCKAHGKKYKDYKSALINFVKRDIEEHKTKATTLSKKRGGVWDARTKRKS